MFNILFKTSVMFITAAVTVIGTIVLHVPYAYAQVQSHAEVVVPPQDNCTWNLAAVGD